LKRVFRLLSPFNLVERFRQLVLETVGAPDADVRKKARMANKK
jgi:hypothetical protein